MLEKGDKISDFKAPLDNGDEFNYAVHKNEEIVFYFYPKNNTPGCTKEACNIRDNYKRLLDAGLKIYGISTDSIKSHQKFKDKYSLPFPLIADKGKEIAKMFDVLKKTGTAQRVTFLVKENEIKYVWEKVKTTDHVNQILDVYEALQNY